MVSSGSPHVLRAHVGVHCTCGEPNELELAATRGLLNVLVRRYVGVEPLAGGLSGEHGFLPLGPFLADIPAA